MGVLPVPHGQQREVVYLREKGHCVVLGAAGSGKTVMAVHRARHLAEAPGVGGPTLLVTFNQALVPYLRKLADHPDVTVQTYHALARGYVSNRMKWREFVCGRQLKERLVARALDDVRAAGGPVRSVLNRPVGFFLDELHWLAAHGISTPDSYTSGELRRIGRGTKLEAQDRAIAYRVYQRYVELREQANRRCDWDDLASIFLRLLQNDNNPRRYRHVVVDEGQDFTPEMIRSLAVAIPEEGSLTFFADYAQQLYGSRMSWRSLGLDVSRTVEFAQNYRNSLQVAHLARAITHLPHFRDEVELVEPKDPKDDGLKPALVEASSKDEQATLAVKYATNLSSDERQDKDDHGQVVILAPNETLTWRLQTELGESRRTITRLDRNLDRWRTGRGIFYGTYRDARGLEFDTVILPFCDADVLPSAEEVYAFGLDEAHARQARQLYVAVTRARKNLTLIYSGRMTELLPSEASGLYERLTP
ncbi:UvrD-helicase domain-containing protein [Saccharopolyspora sp. NPDC050642]|uniref:UvrD-helicase domain-containing protein n=1 Tax=Saccharopolyspora sp. NPDC050642 TaxID=3157099 RepID=UPI00340FBB23